MRIISRVLPIFLVLAFSACPHPIPFKGPGGVVDCSTKAVKNHALSLIPKVNQCLVAIMAPAGIAGCLLGLIDPAAGITEEILACVTQNSGSSYAAMARENPADTVSDNAAKNARAFLTERGYTFK